MKEFIKETPKGVIFKIHAHTGKPAFKVLGFSEWLNALEIEVCSIPKKGKANKEIGKKLSEFFQAKCTISSGFNGREKQIIAQAKKEEILEKIQNLKN